MENDSKTILIPNELCRRAGIAASWRPINEISIFPYEKRSYKQKDGPSNFASDQPSSIFHVRHEVILFHPILRKLVNESNANFLALQEFVAEKPPDSKTEILKMSRQYRSIIRACLLNLQDDIAKTNITPKEKQELKDYITIFYSIECIWHLCEILFIDVIPGNIVLPPLLDWVRFHFPKPERNAATLLSGDTDNLDLEENYWPTVFGNFLQGRMNVVRALLQQHSAAQTAVFQLALNVLKNMPILNIVPVSEFSLRWRHWTAEIQIKLDAKQFMSNRNLDLIMRLIVGEESAWAEMHPHCETWYDFLAGWLFYTEPTVKTFELGRFADQSIDRMRVKHHLKHLDRVLLAFMKFDLFEVIKEIQEITDNGWLVSHLTDILFHSGRLAMLENEVQNFSSEDLRESFILDYGTTLMGHKSLWQVGLSYLDHCHKDGLPAIKLLLPRVAFDSEAKATNIISEAKNRGLNKVAQSISKILAMRSLSQGRLGNALTWASKSQDRLFISRIADKFLQEYVDTGEWRCIDMLDDFGSSMLASERLIFLGKFIELHKLYQAKEYKECGELYMSLLNSKLVPQYFWSVLFDEALTLAENEQLVFSSDQTEQIIYRLEEKQNIPELVSSKVYLLRLALARNLKRALMYEAQLY
ncbi:unnamed protein product [Ceutorhynchus assimilis]|uniref:Nuclear pore complex protein Nup85 n=1 Tax=Ceutorhynchus assimilis TaxID=467358 RepID=A0A9N9MRH2_9CUCU|nr:unnamed protein product [Ceutorhynchus assimilis]